MSRDDPRTYAARINWAVTTVDDCVGLPPGTTTGYAIVDLDEDDPPIAVCDIREDAELIVAALRQHAGWDPLEPITPPAPPTDPTELF